MLRELREFAVKGNVVDMAVGVIIGLAFAAVVGSLVSDVLMPPIGLLLGGVDFSDLFFVLREGAVAGPYPTVAAAQEAGAVTINYGLFLDVVISFLLVALAVFLVVRSFNALKRRQVEAPATAPEASRQEVLLEEIRDLLRPR
jgi:large conductance mechanosensitive channel